MGQLINDTHLGLARNDAVDVHLFKHDATVIYFSARHDFQVPDFGLGVGAAIGLNESENNVVPLASQQVGVLQHLVSFTNSRSGANIYPQTGSL
jgi:hypothetical protein